MRFRRRGPEPAAARALTAPFVGLLVALWLAVAVALALAAVPACASVVIAGTRVIYPAAEQEVTLRLSNVGKSPALAQVWLDEGDPKVDPSLLNLPFMLTPALARLDPGKAQTVRIVYTGEPMPPDRESLLWFNLLDVPPSPAEAMTGPNYVQLAFRTRLKFFFRPAGVAGRVDDAPGTLVWRIVTEGGKSALRVSNPSSYYVTIISARVGGSEPVARFDAGDMVAPGGAVSLPLSATPAQSGTVSFTTLDDYGAPVKHEASLKFK
ncbi:fimbria/pilus periplasmic chaperone [Caballeronia sp. LZ065]|uniref:fimbria/pilus periplasmic chaperone n=1 Tax=Caballeronia sp. LZ065 TaxID=3038571 RepID=UPI002862FA0C|nr:fimbria/pilus periplasmic chaperone [Caballeronia sp. LZ065]MDR5778893.1 fimbria/pilus periplasmic chaperone [Caballeronia sp. LZ065]